MIAYKQFLNETYKSNAEAVYQRIQELSRKFPITWRHHALVKDLENVLVSYPNYCYMYAKDLLKRRFLKGEESIIHGRTHIVGYALNVVGGRWKKAESWILRKPNEIVDSNLFLDYLDQVMPGQRWPEAESHINNDFHRTLYRMNYYDDKQKLQWLKKEGIDKLFNLFKYNMSVQMQEYVINHKPHLINQIRNLDPGLARKYQHEKELAGLDI